MRLNSLSSIAAAAATLAAPLYAQRPVKVFISVDMEGIGGVVTDQQLGPTGFEYNRAREWMAAEALAAIAGAREAGATQFVVADAHGNVQGVRAHTISSATFAAIRINEQAMAESGQPRTWAAARGNFRGHRRGDRGRSTRACAAARGAAVEHPAGRSSSGVSNRSGSAHLPHLRGPDADRGVHHRARGDRADPGASGGEAGATG